MKEVAKLVGTGRCYFLDDNGVRHNEVVKHNAIVTVGFDAVRKMMSVSGDTRPAAFGHVAIGSGSSQTLVAMTALETEIGRLAGTWTYDENQKSMTISATWARGVITAAIQEVGIFNAATGGVMLDRLTYESPIPPLSNMQFVAEVTIDLA